MSQMIIVFCIGIVVGIAVTDIFISSILRQTENMLRQILEVNKDWRTLLEQIAGRIKKDE